VKKQPLILAFNDFSMKTRQLAAIMNIYHHEVKTTKKKSLSQQQENKQATKITLCKKHIEKRNDCSTLTAHELGSIREVIILDVTRTTNVIEISKERFPLINMSYVD
jgi:hypothetical protein